MKTPASISLPLACPDCHTALAVCGERARCGRCGHAYERRDGIWRLLRPDQERVHEAFLHAYRTVREAEGWGYRTPEAVRRLPYPSWRDPHRRIWQIRARSYETVRAHVVQPLERHAGRPLVVLDLGAGNGWLAHRLAARGHRVAAVDLNLDGRDGLGAHVHYATPFLPVQATFDALPFPDARADLLVFNGALHYSSNYATTLREALRVLQPDGRLVVMDTPMYRDEASGRQMTAERRRAVRQSLALDLATHHESYLTFDRLDALGQALHVSWQLLRPSYGLRWALRPWVARLLRRREPATFGVVVMRKDAEAELSDIIKQNNHA